MKTRKNLTRLLALVLVLITVTGLLPLATLAAVYDIGYVSTGLVEGSFDPNNTVALPIQILDYKADGMLFEFPETIVHLKASDFGASFDNEYSATPATYSYYGLTWSLKTSTYATYVRGTFNSTETSAFTKGRTALIAACGGSTKPDDMRYLVFVYRTNVTNAKINVSTYRQNMAGGDTAANMTGDITIPTSAQNWTYYICDIKTGELGNTWNSYGNITGLYLGMPPSKSGDWIELSHIAGFSSREQAEKFGEYALTDGSDRGNNRAFGLLTNSSNQSSTNIYASVCNQTSSVAHLGSETSTREDMTTLLAKGTAINNDLGYTLLGQFNGTATAGLLDSTLSSDGLPVYKAEVVTYIANLLKSTLEIPEWNSEGWKNYRYVRGETSSVYGNVDLATALRTRIARSNNDLGTYAASAAKNLRGTWAEVADNITTYHDAAYFLLNSLFIPGSYNEPQTEYDHLLLSTGIDSTTNSLIHFFDAGLVDTTNATASTPPAINYDKVNKTIQNTSAAAKANFVVQEYNSYTYYTTLNPFLPVSGAMEPVYYQEPGALSDKDNLDTLKNRNFNYVISSTGEFVYRADDELFFEFEGDDDVYLFINGELVLDMGGAHGNDGYRMDLNDYVAAAKAGTLGDAARNNALNLQEGATYSFSFFYMERHSYGANMRINTNIRFTDTGMQTEKAAYQDGYKREYGGPINKNDYLEYSFKTTNAGNTRLYDFTFEDPSIGVTLDYENGLVVTGNRVYDKNGGQLDASDLVVYLNGYSDWSEALRENRAPVIPTPTIKVTFDSNEELIAFMDDLSADDTSSEGGSGLWPYSSIEIRGIYYMLTEEQGEQGVFTNTVYTTANTSSLGTGVMMRGEATMQVTVPNGPTYYMWSGNQLRISKADLVADIHEAVKDSDNSLNYLRNELTAANITKMEMSTRNGNPAGSAQSWLEGTDLVLAYTELTALVTYVKFTYTYGNVSKTVVVPVMTYTQDVTDRVFVLDYGLKADLSENLFAGDVFNSSIEVTHMNVLGLSENTTFGNNHLTTNAPSSSCGFQWDNGQLTYQPKGFINDIETAQLVVSVYEDGHAPTGMGGELDITKEVQMFKNISVVPANVVYYEDDFPAIRYENVSDDGTVEGKPTFEAVATPDDLQQSTDQDQEYGQDDVYSGSENDDFSAESYHKITIDTADRLAFFEFKGTGFELISRTESTSNAIFIVTVKDASGNVVANVPVIPEYDNAATGDKDLIYQVPVVRIDGLELGTYKVYISGVPDYDFDHPNADGTFPVIPSYMYIDGLRIFQPIGSTSVYYNDSENGMIFAEARDLIVEGTASAVAYDNKNLSASAGNVSWTENLHGTGVGVGSQEPGIYNGNQVSSVDDYLLMGPNNEVYMNGDSNGAALLFYFNKVDGAKTNSLQIALRSVDKGLFYGVDSTGNHAEVHYGVMDGDTLAWQPLVTLNSAAQQYYTIDLSRCPVDENGRIQVSIKVASGMVSFSTIKYNGLTLANVKGEAGTKLYYDNGVLKGYETNEEVEGASYIAFDLLHKQMAATAIAQEYVTTAPQPSIELDHPSLSFEDEIKYNVYFTTSNMDNVKEMGLITFDSRLENGTIDDALEILPNAKASGDLFMAQSAGIPAKRMGDVLYFKVYAKLADGTYVYSPIAGYSAKAYAETILNGSGSAELKTLMVALLEYGAEAQKLFGYNTASLMDADLTAEQRALVDGYSSTMVDATVPADDAKIGIFDRTADGYTKMVPTVSFDSAFAVNYYFTAANAPEHGMTLYYWTAEAYAAADVLSFENMSGSFAMVPTGTAGQYWGEVTGIAAKELDTTIYVAAIYEYDGTQYCTGVLPYHVGSYCSGIVAGAGDTADLAAATAVYGYYAENYFDSFA